MRIQDHVVEVSELSAAEFFRYASAVPIEKLDWKPLDTGQSVLEMCREIAITPTWAVDVLTDAKIGKEEREARMNAVQSWQTAEECKTQFQPRFAEWASCVRAIPDEGLSATRWLPYNGGRDHTILELLEYVRWNSTYHLGQIAYIQTLYGDRAMY